MNLNLTNVENTLEKYSVFVDGTEVNDYYLNYYDARLLAEEYMEDGYENVIVCEIKDV